MWEILQDLALRIANNVLVGTSLGFILGLGGSYLVQWRCRSPHNLVHPEGEDFGDPTN